MSKIYRMTLRLYPARYRLMFGVEMAGTFDQAADTYRKLGRAASLWFAMREEVHLLKGVVSEWLAQLVSGDRYLADQFSTAETSEMPLGVADLEDRIRLLIRGMEYAIAHHDFVKARHYSNEERATRAQLDRAAGRHGCCLAL